MNPRSLVIIATFFTTVANLSFKLGSGKEGVYLLGFPINLMIFVGFCAYGISALLFLRALRNGDLSVLYPLWSLSFVWIFLVSKFVLNESISLFNWAGLIFIVSGVSLVGRGKPNA